MNVWVISTLWLWWIMLGAFVYTLSIMICLPWSCVYTYLTTAKLHSTFLFKNFVRHAQTAFQNGWTISTLTPCEDSSFSVSSPVSATSLIVAIFITFLSTLTKYWTDTAQGKWGEAWWTMWWGSHSSWIGGVLCSRGGVWAGASVACSHHGGWQDSVMSASQGFHNLLKQLVIKASNTRTCGGIDI